MAGKPEILDVELEDRYYHIRFSDRDIFDIIRTPDWAANVAESVSKGAEVRMGKKKDSDDWDIETVLIEKEHGEEEARSQARKIVEKIRS